MTEGQPGRPPVLPCIAYSTAGLPADQQFDVWRDLCRPTVEMLRPPDAERGFAASASIWKLGRFAISRVTSQAAGYRRTVEQIRRDGLDHFVIGVLLSGSYRFRTDGEESSAAPGIPHLFSLVHAFEGERNDVTWLCLFIARDAMPELAPAFDAPSHQHLRTTLGRVLAGTLQSIAARLPCMTEGDSPRAEAAIGSLLAACLGTPEIEIVTARAQLDRQRRSGALAIIRQHLGSPGLGPGLLCKLSGMSRSQLYRCFEPLGGVARAIQDERLRQAHAALASSQGKVEVGRVGDALGFGDPSTFSRAFRRAFGYSPSTLLAHAAAGKPPPEPEVRPTGLITVLGKL